MSTAAGPGREDGPDNRTADAGVLLDVRGPEFDEFVVGASTRLLRAAFLLTGDVHAAEDLVQDVLARMYVAWPRIDDPTAYARRALTHGATNRWRSRRRRPEVPLEPSHDRPGWLPDAERLDVLRALADLPDRQRAVVVLRFLEDASVEETARALGCTAGTVKSHTARALPRLRALLTEPSERQT